MKVEMEEDLASLIEDPVRAKVKFELTEGEIDWFDLKIVLDVEGLDLSQKELRSLVAARGGYVRMDTGGWMRLEFDLDDAQRAAVDRLGLDIFDLSGEEHKMHVLQLSDPAAKEVFDKEAWDRICERAAALKLKVTPAVPEQMDVTLRNYQVEGFHFLSYLASNRFGGILADDMGLGKTVQALTWIVWMKAQAEEQKPTLVVCPKSVLDVWSGECKKFAGHLRVQVLRTKEDLDLELLPEIDLLVLNYSQLRVNGDKLQSIDWMAVVLDEGQQIKNPDSKAAKSARELKANHRLVLTGTPIENRLLDMWSLMAFAMPGVLGDRKYFKERFDRRKDPGAQVRLSARLRPFLLRRTKSQVAVDLPPRTEEEVFCKMEGVQEEMYNAELKRIQNILMGLETDDALRKNSFVVLQGLMRLRQICCHPALLDSAQGDEESAKMNALFYLLDQLKSEGHKVLVFSQFVTMLDLIKERLEEEKRPYEYLTGQTKNRQEVIDRFQTSEDPTVFLLSLKAGGSGLNLTAASYVVLYDPWWNPAVENQAIDRTHRIGQKSKVIAYRLLMRDSVEEKIRVLQEQKMSLVTGVLGQESFTKNLTKDDLSFLFETQKK
ncbi:MAG: DEAD/DEAH box helicase, partial [Verrucomicrobiales bacterium]|nr:DEAD/DEAH box helicase [Verrucomicrobiales bacterium]